MSGTRKSLLIDATHLRDFDHGVARRLINLWPKVKDELVEWQIGVVVLAEMQDALQSRMPKVACHATKDLGPGPLRRYLRLNPHVLKIKKEHGYHWIHQDGFLALDGPTILTVHDWRHLDPEFSPWWRRIVATRLMARMSRRALPVVTVSQHAKRQLLSNSALQDDQIFVVANGVDPRRFVHTPGHDFLSKFGLMPGSFRLFVGHLERRKNIAFLVDLQRKLRGDDSHATLVIASHLRQDSAECRAWVKVLQEEPGVILCSEPSDEVLGELYRGASCFLMPSELEGFGLTPLEALALGTPCVASRIGAHLEVLGDEFCFPLLAESWCQAIAAMENEGQHQTLVARGCQIAASYTWESSAQQMSSVLASLSP